MPGVVVAAPLGHSGDHRQHRGGPLQRLDLRFFVHGEDYRVRRRRQVQAHDVADLVNQQRVGGDLEVLGPPGLQAEGPPDAVHGRRGDAYLPGQLPFRPVRGPFRHLFQGAHHHLLDLGVGDGARHSRPGLVAEPVQPAGQEPGPPLRHGDPADPQPRRDGRIVPALSARQHDPRPQRQPLGGLPPPRPVLQHPPLSLRQHQRLQPRITHATSRPRPADLVTTQPGPETKHDSRGAKRTQDRDTSRGPAPRTGTPRTTTTGSTPTSRSRSPRRTAR